MFPEKLKLFIEIFPLIMKFLYMLAQHKVQAVVHRWTYREFPSVKNVVIVGGSFAGCHLANRLANTLPSGYRVVLIEKNSHFNYSFNFPRYSVVPDREHKAFIPYTGITHGAPAGAFQQVQDLATGLEEHHVVLKSGSKMSFDYLAIATGSKQSPPAKLLTSEKDEECAELRQMQSRIMSAQRIALVGGGPVGVQMAGDIKSVYPEKDVVLIHSRAQLLPNFGERLHKYVAETLQNMGVVLLLDERPQLPVPGDEKLSPIGLHFKDGRSEIFDLVIPCTGQSPNSSILRSWAPDSISEKTGRILVKPTLQLQGADKSNQFPNIFALGDVAETSGPKMARAGLFQAEIVRDNLISLITGRENLKEYSPIAMEGAIKLSLGKDKQVAYMQHIDGTDFLKPGKSKNIDLEVRKAWKMLGADVRDMSV